MGGGLEAIHLRSPFVPLLPPVKETGMVSCVRETRSGLCPTPKHPADICLLDPFVSALLVKRRLRCSTGGGGLQSIFTNIMRAESASKLFKLSSGGFSEYYYRDRAYFTHVYTSLVSSLHVPALDPPRLTSLHRPYIV